MGMKFKVGDRVVLKRSRFFHAAGTVGVVRRVHKYYDEPYEVRFDGAGDNTYCSAREIDFEHKPAPTFTVKYKPPSFDTVDAAIDYATKLATATGVAAEVIRG